MAKQKNDKQIITDVNFDFDNVKNASQNLSSHQFYFISNFGLS